MAYDDDKDDKKKKPVIQEPPSTLRRPVAKVPLPLDRGPQATATPVQSQPWQDPNATGGMRVPMSSVQPLAPALAGPTAAAPAPASPFNGVGQYPQRPALPSTPDRPRPPTPPLPLAAAPPTTMPNPQPPRSPFDTMPASGLGGSPVSTPLAVPNGVVPYTPTTPTPPPMARQPTGLNPAMAGLGQINPIANAVNTAPMANAKASLEASLPNSQQNIDRRSASTNPMISDVERQTTADMDRQSISNEASATGVPHNQLLRNREIANANRQMHNSERGQQNAGDQAWLEKTRAAAMPQKEAQENINNTKGLGTDRRDYAVARGEKFKRDNDAADKLRRSEPLAQMNIARAQERPAQLLEKRERREQMGAANRLQRMAMGQRDPRVKAQMTGQAADMAKAVGQRQPAPRTTYGDIVDKQKAEQLASQKIDADAGGNYATPRGQRDLAEAQKTQLEIDGMKKAMSPIDLQAYEAASKRAASEYRTPADDRIMRDIERKYGSGVSPAVTPSWSDFKGAVGGVGKSAPRIDLTSEADAARYPKGTEVYINGRRAIVE